MERCMMAAIRGCSAPGVPAVTTARRSTAFQSSTSSARATELTPNCKRTPRQTETVLGGQDTRMSHLPSINDDNASAEHRVHQPSRIAYHSMNPMTAPVATNDTRLVAKYGYTMSSSPAAICGHRSCFLPYMNRANPTQLGMSETNSHAGSRDIQSYALRLAERTTRS